MRFWQKIKNMWHRIRRCFVAEMQSPAPPDVGKPDALPGGEGIDGIPEPIHNRQGQSGVCGKSATDGGGDAKEAEMSHPKHPMGVGGKRKNGAAKKHRRQDGRPSMRRAIPVKPEWVCRKVDGRWSVFLSAPEACAIDKVMQSGDSLPKKDGGFCLLNFTDDIVINSAFGNESAVMRCFHDDFPPIFKLCGNGNNAGRQVEKISRGDFVVMAPKDWRRTGKAGIEKESCADLNFTAHFFFADGAGVNGGFEEYPLPCGKSQYQLDGRDVYDSNSHKISLFVGPEPPMLKTESGVRIIRIGEEGGGGWRGDNYERGKSLEDILRDKGRRQGWFYVRVYDNARKAIDSGDFRYCANLRKILINGAEFCQQTLIMPGADGHRATQICLIGADGNNLRAENAANYSCFREDNVVVVPPVPQSDIKMTLTDEGQMGVDIRIMVPLAWWRIAKDGNSPGKWRDTPIGMTHAEFGDYAADDAVIDILVPPGIDGVTAGFNKKCGHSLHKNKSESPAVWQLPLNSFADYEELEHVALAHALHIQCGGKMVAVVRVVTGGVQTPACPKCIPAFRSGGRRGWRRAKGFSHGELRASGLTKEQVREMGVRMDRRRRTAHRVNVNALTAKGGSNAKSG